MTVEEEEEEEEEEVVLLLFLASVSWTSRKLRIVGPGIHSVRIQPAVWSRRVS